MYILYSTLYIYIKRGAIHIDREISQVINNKRSIINATANNPRISIPNLTLEFLRNNLVWSKCDKYMNRYFV